MFIDFHSISILKEIIALIISSAVRVPTLSMLRPKMTRRQLIESWCYCLNGTKINIATSRDGEHETLSSTLDHVARHLFVIISRTARGKRAEELRVKYNLKSSAPQRIKQLNDSRRHYTYEYWDAT